MAVTWDQLTFLSPAQQAKAAQLATIGAAVALYRRAGSPVPDISSVTYSQAKAAEVLLRQLQDLVGPAAMAIDYIRQVQRQSAVDTMEASNP